MKRAAAILSIMIFMASVFYSPALAYDKLEKGMSGENVLCMQLALKSLGYAIEADGKYGAATVRIVKSFQRQHGLSQDGVAGNQTLTVLYSLAPSYAASPLPLP